MEDENEVTVLERDNGYYDVDEGDFESPSKRSRLSLMSQQDQQQSDFPVTIRSPPIDFPISSRDASKALTLLSDSGETVTENTVSYVARAKDNRNGTNIVRHVTAHEKISNSNKNRQASAVAPFATEFNNIGRAGVNLEGRAQNQHPVTSSIHPVLPPSSWHVESDINDVVEDIYDAPPPPGTIVLSDAIKRKVLI